MYAGSDSVSSSARCVLCFEVAKIPLTLTVKCLASREEGWSASIHIKTSKIHSQVINEQIATPCKVDQTLLVKS